MVPNLDLRCRSTGIESKLRYRSDRRAMSATTTVTAQLVTDLRDLIGDDKLVGVAIDYDFEPIVFCHHRDEPAHPVLAAWAKELGDPWKSMLRVWHGQGTAWAYVDLPIELRFGTVQRVSDGRWLVVISRAKEPEHNATLFSSDGAVLGTFHAGDAIEDAQVTPDGRVWLSNFDEGVFSDDSELSEGLICLDLLGRPVFRYSSVVNDPDVSIADCYAINVVSETETWLCPYTDFPLVQLKTYEITGVWKGLAPPGSHAFAVYDSTALFAPGYHSETFTFLDFTSREVRKLRVVTRNGRHIGQRHMCAARGSKVYAIDDGRLYLVDLTRI